ncbi:hypothetical protein NPIL_16651 [Nephila pilipes]|uniref:Uncharacterized protein n=1 Tax=Nephila pilipes TaxID=299642 RepID=A0A8X6P8C4_NEPPI|nr:hypothetical protein NPIL_16651 [Nephila pilipes]
MRYDAISIERVLDPSPTLILSGEGRVMFVNTYRYDPSSLRLHNKLRCDDEIKKWSRKQLRAGQRSNVVESCGVETRVT